MLKVGTTVNNKRLWSSLTLIFSGSLIVAGCTAGSTHVASTPTSKPTPSATFPQFEQVASNNLLFEATKASDGKQMSLSTQAIPAGTVTLQAACIGSAQIFSLKIYLSSGSEIWGIDSQACNGSSQSVKFVSPADPSGYTVLVDAPKGTQVKILLAD